MCQPIEAIAQVRAHCVACEASLRVKDTFCVARDDAARRPRPRVSWAPPGRTTSRSPLKQVAPEVAMDLGSTRGRRGPQVQRRTAATPSVRQLETLGLTVTVTPKGDADTA